MAKVIITLKDGPDGKVECSAEFRPPVKGGETGTPAQTFAMDMLERSLETTEHEEPRVIPPSRTRRKR